MNRALQIRRAILAALKDTNPFLLPETTLFADVNLRLSEAVTKIEVQSALRELEGQSRVLSVKNEDEQTKWKITDNGFARLKELGG